MSVHFSLQYQITFFGCGLCRICAWDFIPLPEEKRNLSRKLVWKRRYQSFQRFSQRLRGDSSSSEDTGLENGSRSRYELSKSKTPIGDSDGDGSGGTSLSQISSPAYDEKNDKISPMETPIYTGAGGNTPSPIGPVLSRYRSHHDAMVDAQTYHEAPPEIMPLPIPVQPVRSRKGNVPGLSQKEVIENSPAGKEKDSARYNNNATMNMVDIPLAGQGTIPDQPQLDIDDTKLPSTTPAIPIIPTPPTRTRRQAISHLLELIFTPITTSLVISLPIALVTPLKALFTTVDGWTGSKIPNAPDGNPPLSFILTVS